MSAAEKSEFGVDGVVGGMTVMALLAFTMRSGRDRIAAVENGEAWQANTVNLMQKGLLWSCERRGSKLEV